MPRKKNPSAAAPASAESDAPASAKIPAELQAHIRRIKKAKKAAGAVFDGVKMDAAQASIEILWEAIFDYLCKALPDSPAEMASLAAVIQRLAASRLQLANLASKLGGDGAAPDGLTDDDMAKIESALKLL